MSSATLARSTTIKTPGRGRGLGRQETRPLDILDRSELAHGADLVGAIRAQGTAKYGYHNGRRGTTLHGPPARPGSSALCAGAVAHAASAYGSQSSANGLVGRCRAHAATCAGV